MKEKVSIEKLLLENEELKFRLEELEQLVDAIKAGEVDAFALNRNNEPEIFTLESGDYAYRMLVENLNEGALTLSDDGLIVYTNNYFHDLLGLSYDAVIGKSIFNFIHSSSTAVFQELFKKGLTGQTKGELNLCAGSGTISVYVSLTSLYPKLPTIGMVVTDLTEKKKHEATLLQNEEELQVKARQLELQNDELQKMNKDLESFAYISSHDLQEPLRKIQIFASRITEKEYGNLSDSGKEMFNRMYLAAKRMQTLIDDLLAYSRSNNAKKNLETVDLNVLLDEVKKDLREEMEEKQAVIVDKDLCEAKIIPFQFRQMMHNLIGNALKFAKPGTPPRITIASEHIDNYAPFGNKKACHITVADNGIGFEPQYSEKIFKVFQRLHDDTEFQGTGIGLAIVKKIVENHNGIIMAEGESNKGAKFDIYIPG